MLISIVDDDPGIGQSLKRMLRAYGFEAKSFTSATDFLSSGQMNDTACLILDVRMPDKSGLDLQNELRSRSLRVPIIFITGYLDNKVRDRALKEGAVDILEKPFDDQLLLGKITQALIPPVDKKPLEG